MTQSWKIFLASILLIATLSCSTESQVGGIALATQEPPSQEFIVQATVEARSFQNSIEAAIEATVEARLNQYSVEATVEASHHSVLTVTAESKTSAVARAKIPTTLLSSTSTQTPDPTPEPTKIRVLYSTPTLTPTIVLTPTPTLTPESTP
ncbi:uncharacterized protein METZ01_LOCUS496961, partial [marine metagenome]